jgi:uncharacterized protein (TIGR03083 family)
MQARVANHEPVINQIAQVWSSTVKACDRLGNSQWDEPTDCPGWTVKDQLSHLIGIERMMLGDSSPELADVPVHVTNSFGEINEAWVDARRSVPGGEVLEEFVEVTHRRLDALRAMPPAKFDEVGWSPVGDLPFREFMQTRILDSWAHEQDVRRAVGRPGGRNGVGEAAVLDRCERSMPYVVGKRVAPRDGTAVLFSVAGVMGRQILVTMDSGRASRAPLPSAVAPTVMLTMDQETFWRLGFGRVAPVRVVASGQVRVDGDMAIGHKVLESMAFMP